MATMVTGAYFREAGAGPAVVCVHASASSSAQWRPLMDRLAPRFRTLAVDLYGSGKSARWPSSQTLSLADEVSFLDPVLAAAGDRFHLVGHSYGGAVALKAALAYPDRPTVARPLRTRALLAPLRRRRDPARGPGDRSRAR
jgi:pimeloyl-ACP methyl ester carboxylesterase